MSQEKQVLEMLMGAKFAYWYENEFLDFVEGAEDAPSETDVLKWLANELK